MKIRVNWSLCDGNGMCAIEAPMLFELDEDDQLKVLQEEFGPELEERGKAAVRACPKRALRLED